MAKKIRKALKGFFLFVIMAALVVLPFVLVYLAHFNELLPYLFVFALYYLFIGHFGTRMVLSFLKEILTKSASAPLEGGVRSTAIQVNQTEPVKDIVVYFRTLHNLRINTDYSDLPHSARDSIEKILGHPKSIHSERGLQLDKVSFGVNFSTSQVYESRRGYLKLRLDFVHSVNSSEVFRRDVCSASDDYRKDMNSVAPVLEPLPQKQVEELERLHRQEQQRQFDVIAADADKAVAEVLREQYFESERLEFVERLGGLFHRNRSAKSLADYLGMTGLPPPASFSSSDAAAPEEAAAMITGAEDKSPALEPPAGE